MITKRTELSLLGKKDFSDIIEMFFDDGVFDYIPHLKDKTSGEYEEYLDDKLN